MRQTVNTAWTSIEGSPAEFGQKRSRLFSGKLIRSSGPLQTPMQKAFRVCTIKAINWIAETGLSYRRRGKVELPFYLLLKKVAVHQKSSGREKPLSEPTVKKLKPRETIAEKELVESPIVEKPLAENPIKAELVIGKPTAQKPTPKKEALHSEWGQ